MSESELTSLWIKHGYCEWAESEKANSLRALRLSLSLMWRATKN
jgi:hypothetical protein